METLVQLNILDLSVTNVTGGGLVYLKGLSQLDELHLAGTKVNGGLENLRGLNKLTFLDLRGLGRNSATTIEPVKGLSKLRKLDLGGTPIDDAALVHLKGLTNLTEIWLDQTKITKEGVASLQKSLTKCMVIHN